MQQRSIHPRPRRHARPGVSLLTSAHGTLGFDSGTLELLSSRAEIEIETTRPDGRTRRTRIWVVVVGGEVYLRSVHGDRGHWFQSALDSPDSVVLHAGSRSIPARPRLARDPTSIERCSAGLGTKYAGDPDLHAMLLPEVLDTTLLVEPR